MVRERALFPPAPERRDAAATWHLTHGAHLAACVALLGARGRQAVVQRDAGALLAALTVCGLAPHWVAPALEAGGRTIHGVTAPALDAALRGAPGARSAIVALGRPDVAGLVEAAHAHGAALMVDASGADDAAVAGALAAGADLVVCAAGPSRDAAHGRFTRARGEPVGALLLGRDAERWIPRAAIDRAVALAAARADVPPRAAGSRPGPVADPPRFVPALPSAVPGPTACTPRAVWLAPQERVAPAAAVGRIAAEALTPDVPGVPAVLPGERLVPDVVATLRAAVDRGGAVHGSPDGLATLAVVVERSR